MEVVASKYRGFRRTLRCLTMGPVIARPAVNGGIRYSSVRQLFHPPAEPGEIGQTPSIRAPSRFGPHSSGRSIASRQFGLDRLHLNLLAAWRTDIPRPDLIGAFGEQFGLGVDRVAQLVAALPNLVMVVQDAVQGADRAEVDALVEQGGVDLRRGEIGEARLRRLVEHGLSFFGRQRTGRAGTGRRFGRVRRARRDGGARQPQGGAGGGRDAGGRARTLSIRICRRCRSDRAQSPAGVQLFLEVDDRLGALQARPEPGIFLPGLGQLGRQRIGLAHLRAAPGSGHRGCRPRAGGASRSGSLNRAPRGAEWRRCPRCRGCRGRGGPGGFPQDRAPAVNVRRLGRSDNSGLAAAGAGTTVGLRPSSVPAPAEARASTTLLGMTTRQFSYALKSKLPGGLCLIIIGTEGPALWSGLLLASWSV